MLSHQQHDHDHHRPSCCYWWGRRVLCDDQDDERHVELASVEGVVGYSLESVAVGTCSVPAKRHDSNHLPVVTSRDWHEFVTFPPNQSQLALAKYVPNKMPLE
jgi:hypothetical protein